MNIKKSCHCPNCDSEKKQAMGEILPYKPSGIFMGISLFCMICILTSGLPSLFLNNGILGVLIGILIVCSPILIYGTYAFLRHLCRPKHLIKYLCLDCNCQYYIEVTKLKKQM